MSDKQIIIATFVDKDKLEWFYGFMEGRFYIKPNQIFKYLNVDNSEHYIMTFRYSVLSHEKLNLSKDFINSLIVHKKGDCLYTINGLNRLIETLNPDITGNIDHSSFKIDWSEYQNKFITSFENELIITDIKRVF
jgi:hypothetical protein